MIWRPRPGQRVRVHYAKHYAAQMPYHGCAGTVRCVGADPGPINALVEMEDRRMVTVPRGNLVRA